MNGRLWGPLESVSVLGLSVVFREVGDTDIRQVWYLSIDTQFPLFHVEFEDGLSTLVLQNREPRHKNLRKSNVFNGPPAHFISHPAFVKLSFAYVAIGLDLAHQRMSETHSKK
ncbi:hypothetical protein [Absidia glauca]|uniref:Uncharacterized protein n=1 Tax=Absidia glauca TaxID=4829 RepID=A0A168LNM3_ABSGL|nr:hypothetical protein [Absidia glauca]